MKLPIFLALAILSAAPLAAPAQELLVRARTTQPPEMGTLHYLELQYGGETFSIVPPADCMISSGAVIPAATSFVVRERM